MGDSTGTAADDQVREGLGAVFSRFNQLQPTGNYMSYELFVFPDTNCYLDERHFFYFKSHYLSTSIVEHKIENCSTEKAIECFSLHIQYSLSKNTVMMREKCRDSEYRKKESERQKLQCRQQKKEAIELEMSKILPLSILFETEHQIEEKTGKRTMDYIVRREVEVSKVTIFVHQKLEEENKER